MTLRVKSTALFLCGILSILPSLLGAQEVTDPREPHQFLTTYIGFDDDEMAELEDGRAFTNLLDTPLKHEIAIFGIVWIDAPIDFFLEKYEDIEDFESGSGVLQIKKLSEPPRPEDFASLTIPDEDFEALP